MEVKYTEREYAEAADLANRTGKVVKIENDKIVLTEISLSLEELKKQTLELVNVWRDEARKSEGAEYAGDTFDVDEISQTNILAQVVMAQLNPAGSFVYRSKSNVDHPLNAAQIIELGVAIAGKIQEIYQKSWDLKARITAAQTVEEIRYITESKIQIKK